MNFATLKALTWATVVAAVASALLLAALGPGTSERALLAVKAASGGAARAAAPQSPDTTHVQNAGR